MIIERMRVANMYTMNVCLGCCCIPVQVDTSIPFRMHLTGPLYRITRTKHVVEARGPLMSPRMDRNLPIQLLKVYSSTLWAVHGILASVVRRGASDGVPAAL